MSDSTLGRVLALALRPLRAQPMELIDSARAQRDGCLAGDHSKSAKRGITLLSAPQWADVIGELGFDLPWHARRANVLIDAKDLGRFVGRSVRIGEVEIHLHGITYPCAHIEEMHPGLLRALTGDRGGVYGKILNDGQVRVGDEVRLV